MALERVGEVDAILFCCGSDPTLQKAIKDALLLAFDNTVLAYFKWSIPTPVMQKTGNGVHVHRVPVACERCQVSVI